MRNDISQECRMDWSFRDEIANINRLAKKNRRIIILTELQP